MKRLKRILHPKHWLPYLRKQPLHVQHVAAIIFASLITGFMAAIILYVDYGFWHDKYTREDDVTEVDSPSTLGQSPIQMFGSFLVDAKDRLSNLSHIGEETLSGKEVYRSDEAVASTTIESDTDGSQ